MAEAPTIDGAERRVAARPGSHLSDKDARLVYEVMSTVEEEDRTADTFIELARPEDSPIHHLCEWDDEAAAEEFRREQARRAMRSVVFRVNTNRSTMNYPVFFATKTQDGLRSYVRREYLLSHGDKADEVLEKAKRDLEAFRNRYWKHRDLLVDALPELREIFSEEE